MTVTDVKIVKIKTNILQFGSCQEDFSGSGAGWQLSHLLTGDNNVNCFMILWLQKCGFFLILWLADVFWQI